jgi:Ca2+/H+ antiporter
MTDPTICPCTPPMKKESFFWFILILDIVFGSLAFIMSLIGLCVYCGPKNFHSGFFKCWAVTRLVIMIILLVLVTIILILVIANVNMEKQSSIFANKALAITIFVLLTLFLVWDLYLSIQFNNAITEYQNNKEGLEEAQDDNKVELNNPPEAEKNDIEKN